MALPPSGDFESVGVIIDDASKRVEAAIDQLDAVAASAQGEIKNTLEAIAKKVDSLKEQYNKRGWLPALSGYVEPAVDIGGTMQFSPVLGYLPVPGHMAQPPTAPDDFHGTNVNWAEDQTLEEQQPSFSALIESLRGRVVAGKHLGLPAWAEDAAYQQQRNTQAYLRQSEEIQRGYAVYWSDPPGAMMDEIWGLRLAKMDADTAANRAVTSAQLRMMHDNRNEAIRQGLAAEQQAFQYHEQVRNRVVDLLKYNLDYDFRAFETQLTTLTAKLDAFASKAQVLVGLYASDTTLYATCNDFMGFMRGLSVEYWKHKVQYLTEVQKMRLNAVTTSVEGRGAIATQLQSTIEEVARAIAVIITSSYSALNLSEQISATADATGTASFSYTQSVSVNVDNTQ